MALGPPNEWRQRFEADHLFSAGTLLRGKRPPGSSRPRQAVLSIWGHQTLAQLVAYALCMAIPEAGAAGNTDLPAWLGGGAPDAPPSREILDDVPYLTPFARKYGT